MARKVSSCYQIAEIVLGPGSTFLLDPVLFMDDLNTEYFVMHDMHASCTIYDLPSALCKFSNVKKQPFSLNVFNRIHHPEQGTWAIGIKLVMLALEVAIET